MRENPVRDIFFTLGLAAFGVYLFPTLLVYYPGHIEWSNNVSVRTDLICLNCHPRIEKEIEYPYAVGSVKWAHLNASTVSLYVGKGAIINISKTPDGSIDELCWMCHIQEDDWTWNRSTPHAVIRVCTDIDCHGDEKQETSGIIWGEHMTNITGRISQNKDSHSHFYNPLKGLLSNVMNEDGGNYSQGYIACLGCHTYKGFDMILERSHTQSLNLEYKSTGWIFSDLKPNLSDSQKILERKETGSVWM